MTDYQIPRNSLAWLLAAQIAVIAPHVTRLPIWVTLVCAGCIGWRVMVYQGRWSYPGRWAKVAFVFAGAAAVPLGYKSFFGVKPWVAMLILAYVLKLLEMHHKRDAYIVILLGYFVAMTQFLFHQNILWTVYTFAATLMITAGLIGLNQTRTHRRPVLTLKTAAVLLAQSLPLMAVLFVMFPRLPPLWTVPMPGSAARTGVSDSMSPGEISRLSRSDSLAFKVTFKGPVPDNDKLYWRGLVLTHYDGETWTQAAGYQHAPWFSNRSPPAWTHELERLGHKVRYTVILDPTHRHWLFTLTAPSLPTQPDIVMLRDFRLATTEPIENTLRYRVTSALDYRMDARLSRYARYRDTRLPPGIDPRARKLAARLYAASSGPRDYIRRVMKMFRTGGYVYTLDPPKLSGENNIDKLLFNTKQGFCEHYAGSFVFLMRAAHIPARVVIGYQGGEYNKYGHYLAVHQYDAHAWAEVWLRGQGWVREDPTAVVSPTRIEDGLEAAVKGDDPFLSNSLLSQWSRHALWLVNLRLELNAIGYYWDSWVVGYTPAAQTDFLNGIFGRGSHVRIALIMMALFFALLGMLGVFILLKRPRMRLDTVDRQYLRYCRALKRQGLARRTGEGPLDYAERVVTARPELRDPVTRVTQAYVDINYGGAATGVARLKRAVSAFRLKTLT